MDNQLDQISALKEELQSIRDEFSSKARLLSQKIDTLELKHSQLKDSSSHIAASPAHQNLQTQAVKSQDQAVDFTSVPEVQQNNVVKSASHAPIDATEKPQKLSLLAIVFSQLLSLMFDWFEPVTQVYQNYKARGMLGIFFLTIAGAGLVLAGFGYLMQLLIDEIGVGSKSLLMSATAIGVIVSGLVLKIKTKFAEFASAIVALGLLLCFSTIYFVGSVYQLIPGIPVLLLYAGTAVACHYLAIWLDTKVIAVLGMVGITLMPLLTGSTIIEPTYYVMALLFVGASSLFIAYKHIGHWLTELTFAFAFLALGWLEASNPLSMSAWMINAFYVLFFAYVVINLFSHKPQTKRYLTLLAAALGGSLLLLLQGSGYAITEINFQLMTNAIISFVVALLFYRVRHPFLSVLVLVTATWIVLTIVALLDATYWGIAWAIEALLLIFMSKRFSLPSIVHQGQGLAAIAVLYCLFAVIPYFPLPALLHADGWIIVIVIALVLSIWQRLIKPDLTETTVKYSAYVADKVYPALVLFESIWLSIIFLGCAYVWLKEWAGLSAILIQAAILFRSKAAHCNTLIKTNLDMYAALLILFPIAYVVMGSEAVNSIRFSDLPLYAKASLVIAFMQLWLWSAFYRRFNPQSSLRDVAEVARVLFYLLLPICWLATAVRHLEEDILLVLWLSPLIAIALAHLTRIKPVLLESKLLFAALSILTIGLLSFDNPYVSSFGLLAYGGLTGMAYYLNRSTRSLAEFTFVQNWAINSVGLMITVFSGQLFNNLFLSLCVLSLYSLAVVSLSHRFSLCKNNLRLPFICLAVISLISWTALLIDVGGSFNLSIEYAFVPMLILCVGFMLYKQQRLPLNESHRVNPTRTELSMHAYLLVTYVLACISLDGFGFTLAIAPLLAIHGATILFLKNRTITTVRFSFTLILLGIGKLALMDAANVELWQKVLLFMGIGVFILFASFWYQKLITKDVELT